MGIHSTLTLSFRSQFPARYPTKYKLEMWITSHQGRREEFWAPGQKIFTPPQTPPPRFVLCYHAQTKQFDINYKLRKFQKVPNSNGQRIKP